MNIKRLFKNINKRIYITLQMLTQIE